MTRYLLQSDLTIEWAMKMLNELITSISFVRSLLWFFVYTSLQNNPNDNLDLSFSLISTLKAHSIHNTMKYTISKTYQPAYAIDFLHRFEWVPKAIVFFISRINSTFFFTSWKNGNTVYYYSIFPNFQRAHVTDSELSGFWMSIYSKLSTNRSGTNHYGYI